MDKPRYAVVFDFDGTLTGKGPSLWAALDEHAVSPQCLSRLRDLRQHYLGRANIGKLTYLEEVDWLTETIEAYVNDGLTVEAARRALASVRLRTGVRECFGWLEARRIPTAVISYGVRQFIRQVLTNNGLRPDAPLLDRIFAADLLTNNGRYTGFIKDTLVLPSNKDAWSAKFAAEHGVRPENILAVGDSGGDAELGFHKRDRLLIAANEEEARRLAKFCGRVVITEDFAPVLAWLQQRLGLPR